MTISIGGIVLSDDLLWENEFDGAEVHISSNHTIGGRAITDGMPLEGGRTFTLNARRIGADIYGALTRAQVKALKAIERSAMSVTFVYEDQTYLVKVASVKMRPAIARPNQAEEDEYTGTITLAEV